MSLDTLSRIKRLIEDEKLASGDLEKLGEGAFGEVFLVEAKVPYVIKLFKRKGMAKSEVDALKIMAEFPAVRVPSVQKLIETEAFDAVVMSYLDGETMAKICLTRKARNRAAAEVANAILGLRTVSAMKSAHGTTQTGDIANKSGFGAQSEFQTWQAFYRAKATIFIEKAQKLAERGTLSQKVFSVMETAFKNFDTIFSEAPHFLAYIHGDLNPENIMLRKDGSLSGIFDPINSFYGDAEYELFQLLTNGGNRYPVLKEYKKTAPLSARYVLKRDFYRLFAEVGYYYDANLSESRLIRSYARSLKKNLKKFKMF